MRTAIKQKKGIIKVKQFVTDSEGQKVAAIIEMEELNRLKEMLEDMSDIKAIEDRKNEHGEIVKLIAKKAKPFRSVKPIHGKGTPASKLLIEDRRRASPHKRLRYEGEKPSPPFCKI